VGQTSGEKPSGADRLREPRRQAAIDSRLSNSAARGVWREIEAEIERRNESGYDRAATLLFDLIGADH
jgi:hypothetical protein